MKKFKEFITESKNRSTCVCTKTIKFKRGLNFFKDFEYGCIVDDHGKVSVSYDDGRFTTMGEETFDKHFKIND